jgi:hypothetical protein
MRGNVDHGAWSANLPVMQQIEIDGFRIYVLHAKWHEAVLAAGNIGVESGEAIGGAA